jgi:DnaJ-class molecular chaperone
MGQVIRPRRLEVKVPPGVKTGSRVRVAGEGRTGFSGGPAGDLYLVVTVLPHARFERKGDALSVDVDVPYIDAILGGEVEVQTLTGKVALRIPELTQNGRQIRLAGKGMPVLGSTDKRGDLYVRVRVKMPERLTDEERRRFEEIRALDEGSRAAAGAKGGA